MATTISFLKEIIFCDILIYYISKRQVSTIKTHISNIYVNEQINPIGICTKTPVFSFTVEAKNNNSSLDFYSITVSETISKNVTWKSGNLKTFLTNNIKYGGSPLLDNTAYTVKITAEISGEMVTKTSAFRTGYIEKAVVISPKITADASIISPLLRHTFFTGAVISHATLYVSGNCLFRPFINGAAVTTNFVIGTKGIANAFDVTSMLTSDNNTLGVWLMRDQKDYKDETPYVECGLNFCTIDGESVTIDLSSDWFYKNSPISVTDKGEIYDNRISLDKWCDSYSSLNDWKEAVIQPSSEVILAESRNLIPLGKRKSHRTETIHDDLTIYDFGAIIAGRLNVKIMGEPGSKLIISYGKTEEELDNPQTQDVYIIKGYKIEVYEPKFSVNTFRYAKLYIDGAAQLISTEIIPLGTECLRATSFLCRCISQYREYTQFIKDTADYGLIPKEYRTLEGMLLSSDKKLLESHYFGLEQFALKSLCNEMLASVFSKISGVEVDPLTRKVYVKTILPKGAGEMQFQTETAFGKVAVFSRKISNKIHTDYVIPLGFKAKITTPAGDVLTLPPGKYMSEEI